MENMTESHEQAAQGAQRPRTGAAPCTINLGDLADDWTGQSVTIRPYLSYAASQRIEAAATRATAEVRQRNRAQRRGTEAETQEIVSEVTPLEFACAVVEESVLSWTVLGYDGAVLEPNRAGVESEQAPAAVLDAVVDEILAHYESQRPDLRRRR